jgi:hypothetical protein
MLAMNDHEKLRLFAIEVQKMIALQKEYFKTSKLARDNKAAPDEVRKSLNEAMLQERRVSKLVSKILDRQTSIFNDDQL